MVKPLCGFHLEGPQNEGPMADIFISYSSKDRAWVGTLAEELASNGWNIWWDRELLAGQDFGKRIAAEIASAKCVVVAWSRNSIESPWVIDEATDALNRGTLVPLTIDGTRPPLGFGRVNILDMSGRHDARNHPVLPQLLTSISQHISGKDLPAMPALHPELQRLLSSQIDGCRGQNLPFRAVHIFMALFQTHADFARNCIRRIDPQKAREFENELVAFVFRQKDMEQGAAFSEFQLHQHSVIASADRLARSENAGVIDERHLFTALLDSPTATVARLREILLPQEFSRLQSLVRMSRLNSGTPWLGTSSG